MSQPFDFGPVLDPAIGEYLPRETLEADIDARLDSGDSGCVLVVGGPGTGKTSLAAHFIHKTGCIHHFLRPGHTEFSLWSDPHGCLASIAFQLRQRFGDDIFPEAVALDVEGRVHTIGKSGSFTGIEIDRLFTLPWRRDNMRVGFSGEQIDGSFTGIKINEVIDDYRGLPLQAFREMALIDPLRRIRDLAAGEKILIWVDGLDEEAIARVDGSDDPRSIAGILPLDSEFAAIGNASLVISSRRGRHLERFEQDGAEIIDLDATEYSEDRRACVGGIFEQELENKEVAEFVTEAQWQVTDFKELVVERAEENPLYVRQLFKALQDPAQRDAILERREIPAGLGSIQKSLLTRLLPSRKEPEHERTWLVLEVLSVAFSELSSDRIAAIAGIEPGQAGDAIARLLPLLREQDDSALALYHSSLRDLVTDCANRGEAWGVDTQIAHGMLADHYFPDSEHAQLPSDDYGFEYGTLHLANADRARRVRLFHMIDGHWRQQLRLRSKTNGRFLADLERCWQALRTADGINPLELPLMACQLGLIHGFIEDAMSEVSNDTLELMVRLGQTQLALQSLPSGETGVSAARRCRAILIGMAGAGFDNRAAATEILREGIAHLQAPEVRDWYFWEIAELLRPGEPGEFPSRTMLEEVDQAFFDRPVDSHTTQAFAELARLWSGYEKDAADFYFEQAANHAGGARDDAKARLVETWLDYDETIARARLAQHDIDPDSVAMERDESALPPAELAEGWNLLYRHRGSGLPGVSVRRLVLGQLEQAANLVEAYAANLVDRRLRGEVYCEATRYYLEQDCERARGYLRLAREAQEFPHSSAPARLFYYAVALQVGPDDMAWAEQTLENVDVNPVARAKWRLEMIRMLLSDHFEQAEQQFESELRAWGNARVNPNVVCEFPAWVARYGGMYGFVERSEAAFDEIEGPEQRRLISIVLCGYYLTSDPDRVAAHLERALAPTEGDGNRLQEWEILAFAAGQLWRTEHGPALLEQALAQIEDIAGAIDGDDEFTKSRRVDFRATALATAAMNVHYGSLEAAERVLGLLAETVPSGIGEEMTFPDAAIPEHRLAGIRWTEYVYGTVAAAIAIKDPEAMPEPPDNGHWTAAVSLANAKAAHEAFFHELPQRLAWCTSAAETAKRVKQPELRRLLLGDAARAYAGVDANQAALDIARPLAAEVLGSHQFLESRRMYGHAYALGRCVEVLSAADCLDEAVGLIWQARIMGAGAFYVLMSTLPEALSRRARYQAAHWQAVELNGFEVYPRDEYAIG